MRSFAALVTAVAFLANAALAHAADGPTTAVAGTCEWSPEPALAELTALVGDAAAAATRAASDAAGPIDPHLVAIVRERAVYAGPREMGKPSGVRTDVVFRWLPAPITNPDDPGQAVFAMNRYQSYRDVKAAHAAWMKGVTAYGDFAGELAAGAQDRMLLIAPAWMSTTTAAGLATGTQLAGEAAFQAPFVAAVPFTAGLSMLPATAMYAESLFNAPLAAGHGASELADGVRTGDAARALKGGAEFSGGVGIALTAAVPLMEGGNALAPRTAPITLFEDGVPHLIEVNPSEIRWVQTSAGGKGRADLLRASMKDNGYDGAPIDVVDTADGLVTLDHTRPAVALEQKIDSIPARLHQPGEPLPRSMAGRFGDAKTWGEAAAQRAANQEPPLPPTGTTKPPRLPPTKLNP